MTSKQWGVFEKSQRREIQRYDCKHSAEVLAGLLNEVKEVEGREYAVWEVDQKECQCHETRGRRRDEYIEQELISMRKFMYSSPDRKVSILLKVPKDLTMKVFAQKVRVSHSLKDLKGRFPCREFHVLCGKNSSNIPQGYLKVISKEVSDGREV